MAILQLTLQCTPVWTSRLKVFAAFFHIVVLLLLFDLVLVLAGHGGLVKGKGEIELQQSSSTGPFEVQPEPLQVQRSSIAPYYNRVQ